MGIKFANQATGTLAAGITAVATSLTLTTGQGARFPAVTAGSGDYFLLTLVNNSTGAYEIVMCVARAGDVLTIFRALEGTTAAAFSAGDLADNRMTAGTMTDLSAVYPSWRNRIRNGRGLISQRGPVVIGASQGYGPDGWLWGASGGSVTLSQNAASLLSSEFQFNIRVVVGTATGAPAAGDYAQLQQPIEGYLVRDLIGQPIGIRFEVLSPKAGQHYVNICNYTGDRSYIIPYTVTAANTPQLVTLSIPAGLITAGTWNWTNSGGLWLRFPLWGGTTYQTATPNTWVVGNLFCAAGQQNLMDTVGNVFAITGVQLEKGTVSSFEHVSIETEWTRAQRYYWQMRRGWGTVGSSTASWRMGAHCPVRMRAPPSLALVGAPPIQVGNTTTVSLTGIGTNYSTEDAVEFDSSTGSHGAAGGTVTIMLAGSSPNYVGVSAEL